MNIVSLTTGPDGSVYVGDFNLVRKITLQMNVFTVLEFEATQSSFEYDLKISPADNSLYLSHAQRHQVWKVLSDDMSEENDPKYNFEVVVGTGKRCLPGDQDNCGDGQLATKARLNYPKGIAIAVDRTMYISDSRNIRVVNPDGRIDTLIGHHEKIMGPPKPLKCERTITSNDKMQLQWPTRLAVDPFDSTLYIADDTMVLRLTPDMRLHVIAGVSPLCMSKDEMKGKPLGPVADIEFSPEGKLQIIEKISRKSSSLFEVGFDGNLESKRYKFGTTTAIAVAPDGSIFVAQNDHFKILKLSYPLLSTQDTVKDDVYLVEDPTYKSVYSFNKYGQHLSTSNLETEETLYTFGYSRNTAFGRLSSVSDVLGNKLNFNRDYTNSVQSIQNALGEKFAVHLSIMGHLEALQQHDGDVRLAYKEELGLLIGKRHKNGEYITYDYDEYGRARSTSSTGGDEYSIRHESDCGGRKGLCKSVLLNGEVVERIRVDDQTVSFTANDECNKNINISSAKVSATSGLCSSLTFIGLPKLWELSHHHSNSSLTDSKVGVFLSHDPPLASKQIRSNPASSSSLMVTYNTKEKNEWMTNEKGQSLLSISYSRPSLVTNWRSGVHQNCTLSYNVLNQKTETNCQRGIRETFSYNDRSGKVESWKRCQHNAVQYKYEGRSKLPHEITLSSGNRYHYLFDSDGGISKIKHPMGSNLDVKVQPGLNGRFRLQLRLPGFTFPLVAYLSGMGRLLSVRLPGDASISYVYRYGADNRLKKMGSGYFTSSLHYHSSGRLTKVMHEQIGSLELSESFYYGNDHDLRLKDGLVKLFDRHVTVSARSGLSSARFTLNVINGDMSSTITTGVVGGKVLPSVYILRSNQLQFGQRETGQFFRTFHSLNETTLTDGGRNLRESSKLGTAAYRWSVGVPR